ARIFQSIRTAITVCVRDAVNLTRKGFKACFIWMCLARECHTEQRSAMERVFKANDRGPFRIEARHLNCVLHRLGARIYEKRALRERARSELIQFLRKLDIALVPGYLEARV